MLEDLFNHFLIFDENEVALLTPGIWDRSGDQPQLMVYFKS
jgi:hypothetical protein